MAKSSPYTEAFEGFWKAYPRKTAKHTAFKAWQKQVDEGDMFLVKAIVDDLEKRTRMKWWPVDKTKVPHGSTWINARRWEDEGWQDDIKTRGKEHSTPVPEYKQRIEDEYGLDSWQQMLNRMQVKYVLAHGHLTASMLETFNRTRAEMHTEMIAAVREEIDLAEDKSKARQEMAMLFANTLCTRFNAITGKSIRVSQIMRTQDRTFGRKVA